MNPETPPRTISNVPPAPTPPMYATEPEMMISLTAAIEAYEGSIALEEASAGAARRARRSYRKSRSSTNSNSSTSSASPNTLDDELIERDLLYRKQANTLTNFIRHRTNDLVNDKFSTVTAKRDHSQFGPLRFLTNALNRRNRVKSTTFSRKWSDRRRTNQTTANPINR